MSSDAVLLNNMKDTYKPDPKILSSLNSYIEKYRRDIDTYLSSLVSSHYPSLLKDNDIEYGKMVEQTAKFTVVGHACAEVTGAVFDSRLQMVSYLYGSCCFLADSFLDDFGEEATIEYLDRFELLLTKGWFDIRNEREQLFYVIISRLFSERDVFSPMLRQAIFWLYLAQKEDCMLRLNNPAAETESRRMRLRQLKECARNRGGHTIELLIRFLVPNLTLDLHHPIFISGALFMHIDDHGDSHFDRSHNRITYMNQVKNPTRSLKNIFNQSMAELHKSLPDNTGRHLLTAFLYRYYITRLEKHRREKKKPGPSWSIYE